MSETHNNSVVLEARGLTRTYQSNKKESFTAVKGIDLHIRRGEVFGLLGTNGAGKTSTMEILEGLAQPSAGEVRVLGLDPRTDRAALRPELGIMLQSGGLPSALTAKETIEMWAGTCSTPLPSEEVLDMVGLSHRESVKVGELSGGEQRRLDLACALVGNPSVLFLDEPTTGLDPESRRNVWGLLRDLKERGVTMVLTTHYLEEAEFLCDRLCIMNHGTIEVEGTLSEVVGSVQAIISFAHPGLQLPPLDDARSFVRNNTVTIETQRLQDHTLAVLQWAQENGIQLEDFAASPATLEQVFMSIAGEPAHQHVLAQ